jgi:DNA-binding NtrC family response regulator
LTHDAREALLTRRWPGNVRELRNALERAAILCEGDLITPAHLPPASSERALAPSSTDLGPAERATIEQVMRDVAGNKSLAAKMLGLAGLPGVGLKTAGFIPGYGDGDNGSRRLPTPMQ